MQNDFDILKVGLNEMDTIRDIWKKAKTKSKCQRFPAPWGDEIRSRPAER